jgi:hypothetical protein
VHLQSSCGDVWWLSWPAWLDSSQSHPSRRRPSHSPHVPAPPPPHHARYPNILILLPLGSNVHSASHRSLLMSCPRFIEPLRSDNATAISQRAGSAHGPPTATVQISP